MRQTSAPGGVFGCLWGVFYFNHLKNPDPYFSGPGPRKVIQVQTNPSVFGSLLILRSDEMHGVFCPIAVTEVESSYRLDEGYVLSKKYLTKRRSPFKFGGFLMIADIKLKVKPLAGDLSLSPMSL